MRVKIVDASIGQLYDEIYNNIRLTKSQVETVLEVYGYNIDNLRRIVKTYRGYDAMIEV